MTDGRNYASWQPAAVINKTLQEDAGMKTKLGVQESIWSRTQALSCSSTNWRPATSAVPAPRDTATTSRPQAPRSCFKSCTDSTQPYGYENSNLKKEYLSREQLQSRMTAPRLSQYQYIERHLKNPN